MTQKGYIKKRERERWGVRENKPFTSSGAAR